MAARWSTVERMERRRSVANHVTEGKRGRRVARVVRVVASILRPFAKLRRNLFAVDRLVTVALGG
jgi:hypothetical protein